MKDHFSSENTLLEFLKGNFRKKKKDRVGTTFFSIAVKKTFIGNRVFPNLQTIEGLSVLSALA